MGYLKVRHDRIAKDPDQRVREALGREPRDFASYAAKTAATGAWNAVPTATR